MSLTLSIEEISAMVNEDMRYNETNVQQKQMELPSKKQFWLGQLFFVKKEIERIKRERRDLINKAAEAYNKDAAVPISEKGVEAMLKSKNEKVKKYETDLADLEMKAEYLSEVVRIYNGATYDIKNIVEMIKLNQVG